MSKLENGIITIRIEHNDGSGHTVSTALPEVRETQLGFTSGRRRFMYDISDPSACRQYALEYLAAAEHMERKEKAESRRLRHSELRDQYNYEDAISRIMELEEERPKFDKGGYLPNLKGSRDE